MARFNFMAIPPIKKHHSTFIVQKYERNIRESGSSMAYLQVNQFRSYQTHSDFCTGDRPWAVISPNITSAAASKARDVYSKEHRYATLEPEIGLRTS